MLIHGWAKDLVSSLLRKATPAWRGEAPLLTLPTLAVGLSLLPALFVCEASWLVSLTCPSPMNNHYFKFKFSPWMTHFQVAPGNDFSSFMTYDFIK